MVVDSEAVVDSTVGVVLSDEAEVEDVASEVGSPSVDVVGADVVVLFLFGRFLGFPGFEVVLRTALVVDSATVVDSDDKVVDTPDSVVLVDVVVVFNFGRGRGRGRGLAVVVIVSDVLLSDS